MGREKFDLEIFVNQEKARSEGRLRREEYEQRLAQLTRAGHVSDSFLRARIARGIQQQLEQLRREYSDVLTDDEKEAFGLKG